MYSLETISVSIVANFIKLRAISTITASEEASYAPFCVDIDCYKCPCGTDTGNCSIRVALNCNSISDIPWKDLDLYINAKFSKETHPELYI